MDRNSKPTEKAAGHHDVFMGSIVQVGLNCADERALWGDKRVDRDQIISFDYFKNHREPMRGSRQICYVFWKDCFGSHTEFWMQERRLEAGRSLRRKCSCLRRPLSIF